MLCLSGLCPCVIFAAHLDGNQFDCVGLARHVAEQLSENMEEQVSENMASLLRLGREGEEEQSPESTAEEAPVNPSKTPSQTQGVPSQPQETPSQLQEAPSQLKQAPS